MGFSIQSSYRVLTRILGLGILSAVLNGASPVAAAERLQVVLRSIEFSVPIQDLETYVETGVITPELNAYARAVPREDFAVLRDILQYPARLNPDAVSRIAYTPMGEIILRRVGAVLQTGKAQNGGVALRSAFVEASRSPDGITLLSVLQHFPDPVIRVNLDAAVAVLQEAVDLYYAREDLLAAVEQESLREAQGDPIDYNQLPDLRQPGSFGWQRQSLKLTDPYRQRSVPTDIYWPNRLDPAPMILISHGVGGTRSSFAYLAEHLASYGFVVIVPEHVGSNAQTVLDFFRGLTEPLPQEAIDRPWDITFLLNVLQYFSTVSEEWRSRLNFDQIGVVGQSFGGYTALAIAGASLNFPKMSQMCNRTEPDNPSLNISLLLQCNTYLLSDRSYILADPRVKAVIAINPFTSHVFGQEGLATVQVPTLIVAGGDDFIVPAGPEQLHPFTWLQDNAPDSPHHYLAVMKNATHFSTIAEEETQAGVFPIPPTLLGPDVSIAHQYLQTLSVAFFQAHVTEDPQALTYLQAQYGNFLSNPVMPLSLLQNLSRDALKPRSN